MRLQIPGAELRGRSLARDTPAHKPDKPRSSTQNAIVTCDDYSAPRIASCWHLEVVHGAEARNPSDELWSVYRGVLTPLLLAGGVLRRGGLLTPGSDFGRDILLHVLAYGPVSARGSSKESWTIVSRVASDRIRRSLP